MDEDNDVTYGLVEDRHLVRWFTEHVGTNPFLVSPELTGRP